MLKSRKGEVTVVFSATSVLHQELTASSITRKSLIAEEYEVRAGSDRGGYGISAWNQVLGLSTPNKYLSSHDFTLKKQNASTCKYLTLILLMCWP